MRLLADENFNSLEVGMLRSRGHDLVCIEEETPGISDQAVLSRATSEERILLTSDKDFGDLVFRDELKTPFGVILFRIRRENRLPSEIAQIIVNTLESRSNWEGHFSVVHDEDDIRPRPLPNP